MTINVKVHDNRIELPPEIRLPDGTEVELVIHAVRGIATHIPHKVQLSTFKGDGLQPGINLDDSRSVRAALDRDAKLSQLP